MHETAARYLVLEPGTMAALAFITDRLPPFACDLEACDFARLLTRAHCFDARRRKAGVDQPDQHCRMDAVREHNRVSATVRVAGEKCQGAATAIVWTRRHGITTDDFIRSRDWQGPC
jgi:hypothetical protein